MSALSPSSSQDLA